MTTMRPVLQVYPPGGFDLWSVVKSEDGHLELGGDLTPAEVGTAMMRFIGYNDVEPQDSRTRPSDPLGSYLYGILALNPASAVAPGGLRAVSPTGVVFTPGCCSSTDAWRGLRHVVEGTGWADFGHDPSPHAERHGDLIRLTTDTETDDSPTIDLPIAECRHLLTQVARDLTAFHALAAKWLTHHLPAHADHIATALALALDLEPTSTVD
ncbi:hypothetical protein V5P93_004976 [Actinokineospora auranticolor]|uniref:Uncharacterized protein n=1 Tax=Actinokineospora auranticolor TaxID=155976 RepID=A0A2S6GBD1_9PSEU|nr:hypothetical protein [Actinokineospora auranticolor]PPK61212.1 hypothetical protein CLV40_1438 [Actinokineospora auranticolor]